jgi:hypothetical protein
MSQTISFDTSPVQARPSHIYILLFEPYDIPALLDQSHTSTSSYSSIGLTSDAGTPSN